MSAGEVKVNGAGTLTLDRSSPTRYYQRRRAAISGPRENEHIIASRRGLIE
jgi:hypothetical protein